MSTKLRPDEAERERAGGRVVVVLVLGLALLAGGGYAAAYAGAGDNVPRGTTVAGVDIGGRSAGAAVADLVDELGPRASESIEVVVDGESLSLDPATAGLGVDFQATVRQAGGGRSWDPARLWDYYTGGDDLDPVVVVDEAALRAAVADLDEQVGSTPRDGRVRFVGGAVKVRDPRVGAGLDIESAVAAVRDAYLRDEAVEVSLVDRAPEIGEAEISAALDEFVNPALSGPVTLKFGRSRVTLDPRDYADALALEPVDGALEPSVDEDVIVALVEEATVGGDGAPVDATVTLVDGTPKVVRSKPGLSFEPADVTAAFLDLVVRPAGERSADVEGTVQPAEFTTRDARQLKIKEQVSEFTTNFPYAEYRNVNLGRAAEIIDGTVLKPGEVFSMNDIVGERTRENGFTEGFIISNGIFKEDLGGGVSQMATTLFNAMFFAGLEDVEHRPHSFYIDRYPVGREATVVFGALDLAFRNDTEYGVLVNAELTPSSPSSQGALTVRMFSTPVWDIESVTGDRYNLTSPKTRTLTTPDCYPNRGYGGFTIDVTRIFREVGDDEVVRRENFNTVYTPSDTVVCK